MSCTGEGIKELQPIGPRMKGKKTMKVECATMECPSELYATVLADIFYLKNTMSRHLLDGVLQFTLAHSLAFTSYVELI